MTALPMTKEATKTILNMELHTVYQPTHGVAGHVQAPV